MAPVSGFEVPVRESTERWTELTLEDGTVLRVKPSVIGAIRIENQWDGDNNPVYALKGGPNITAVVSVPESLMKPSSPRAHGKAN
jgi:hypothetical protein